MATADRPLSADELVELAALAGTMIPQDAALGMPGADDPLIQDDIVRTIGRDLPLVRQALRAIVEQSVGGLAQLEDRDQREALVNDWYKTGGIATAALSRVILAAYYRDDRVLVALGHEARAPFPQGYIVDKGDWALLDVVRARPAFWRDDRVSPDEDR